MDERGGNHLAKTRATSKQDNSSFSRKYAHFITKFRYPIIVFWILFTAFSIVFLPNLNTVVAHTQTTYVPSTSELTIGQNLLKKVDPTHSSVSSAVIAIQNPQKLTTADQNYFKQQLAMIDSEHAKYGIKNVRDLYNTSSSLKSTFFSKDGTTEMAVIGFPGADVSDATKASIKQLHTVFQNPPSDAHIYFTGDAPIQLDDIQISQAGVAKTVGVTIALVLIILLLVFRSFLAPLVTLLAIGLSFMISSGIVAKLAGYGLPISNFTQTFLIAILFGAGTDYSVILINRYREELTREHGNKERALHDTLHAVGKTVIFSSLTVIVSFAVLFLAQFGLYRTAVGVSVGVTIVLLNGMTLLPALMSVFGTSMYWPRKPKPGAAHKPSAFWNFTSKIAVRRPWITLLALVIILVPVALLFTNKRTFDPLQDIPNAPSAQGFHYVSNAFGQGNVLPSQIVLQSPDNLRTAQGLTTINNISVTLENLSSVTEVQSATQPTGTVIKQFQIANQNQQAAKGLNQVQSGLTTLQNKLSPSSASSATSGTQKLVNGSKQVTSGIAQVGTGITSLQKGSAQLATGATKLANGSQTVTQNLSKLASSLVQTQQGTAKVAKGLTQTATGSTQLQAGIGKLVKGEQSLTQGSNTVAQNLQKLATSMTQTNQGAAQLAQGLGKTQQGASQLASGTKNLAQGSTQLSQGSSLLVNALAAWAKANPQASQSPQWAQIVGIAQSLAKGSSSLSNGLNQVATGQQNLVSGLGQLQTGATKLQNGIAQQQTGATQLAKGAQGLTGGLSQLQTGTTSLSKATGQLSAGLSSLAKGSQQLAKGEQQQASGASQLAKGSSQITTTIAKIGSGATSLTNGAQKLASGTKSLESGSKQLTGGVEQLASAITQSTSGLQKAANGVNQINKGVKSVNSFLTSTNEATTTGNPGFYVPTSALTSKNIVKTMNAYISPDGHVAEFTVILNVNPYSMTAINDVSTIKTAAQVALLNSPIHSGTIYATGTTPTQYELNKISNQDFTRTVTIVLAAIFLLLVLMLRSIITPTYIIISLAGTYFVTVGILQTIADTVLGKPGISWPVPFFAFLLLVALGVDYSIFLMSRFEEEMHRGLSPKEAIQEAMGKMGNVIFSAAVIMAGTFGSMTVAGVSSLEEIGISIVVGLFLYFVFFLGFLVPAMAAIIENGHFWPFTKPKTQDMPRVTEPSVDL